MTKILVTGGAGFIGSSLVKRLVKAGHTVRVLDDYSRGTPVRLQAIESEIEMVPGDVRNAADVDAAMAGIELVFHLAAVNGTENFYNHPDKVLDVMVKGTIHTMDSAIKHGVKRYILASSSEVYQQPTQCPTTEAERIIIPDIMNPRFSYSGGKILGELYAIHYLSKSDVESIIFRPHNIYGPDMGNEHVVPQFFARLQQLKKEHAETDLINFPIQGDGSDTRAFCFIEDCIDGLMLLMEKGDSGELYHIGKDEEVSIAAVAHLMAKHLDMKIELQPGEQIAGSTSRRCPDISKMRALGFNPQTSLEEGLRLTIIGNMED